MATLKDWEEMLLRRWSDGSLLHRWWEQHIVVQTLRKTVWLVLTKLNICLSCGPAIMFHGIYWKELKISIHIKPYTKMFSEALFTIGKTRRQLWCPTVGKQINKPVHSDHGIFFSGEKKLWRCGKTWKKCECTWLRERSQPEKGAYCMTPTIWLSGKGKIMETV